LLFTDAGVAIRNPFSTTILNWRDVTGVNTKYVLNIESHLGSTSCWAAVGPSRSQHRAIHPSELRGFHQSGSGLRAADSPRSDSGAAAQIARSYIEKNGAVVSEALISKIEINHRAKYFFITLIACVIMSHLIAYA
jgi:hypothetical protein